MFPVHICKLIAAADAGRGTIVFTDMLSSWILAAHRRSGLSRRSKPPSP